MINDNFSGTDSKENEEKIAKALKENEDTVFEEKFEYMSSIHSDDSIETKQNKIEFQKKCKKRREKLERISKAREDLLRPPDLDPNKMTR